MPGSIFIGQIHLVTYDNITQPAWMMVGPSWANVWLEDRGGDRRSVVHSRKLALQFRFETGRSTGIGDESSRFFANRD